MDVFLLSNGPNSTIRPVFFKYLFGKLALQMRYKKCDLVKNTALLGRFPHPEGALWGS